MDTRQVSLVEVDSHGYEVSASFIGGYDRKEVSAPSRCG